MFTDWVFVFMESEFSLGVAIYVSLYVALCLSVRIDYESEGRREELLWWTLELSQKSSGGPFDYPV